VLTTLHLILRPPRPSDARSIARHANDRNVWLGLRDIFPHPYSLRDAKAFIKRHSGEDPACTFVIEFEGEAVGVVGLVPKDDIFRHSAELGYWIGAPFWGKGLATEAVNAVAGYAFDVLAIERLYAFVFDSNPASFRVLEKCGFEREGTMRRGAIKDRRYFNMFIYSKLKNDIWDD
jgi:ribosomal-protein-alanine N-acetyltransferase